MGRKFSLPILQLQCPGPTFFKTNLIDDYIGRILTSNKLRTITITYQFLKKIFKSLIKQS